MKVGGWLTLIVPPDLAYGPGGEGAVPPDAAFVSVVSDERPPHAKQNEMKGREMDNLLRFCGSAAGGGGAGAY